MNIDSTPESKDLHDLRQKDSYLDSLCAHIQRCVVETVQCMGIQSFPGLPPRVLVTGSSGYCGSALVSCLRVLGVTTVGLDTRPGPCTDVTASVTDREAVCNAVRGCHGIIHTAALHSPHNGTHSEAQYEEVNVLGTKTVLEAGHKETHCKMMIFSSTTSLTITQKTKHEMESGQVTWFDECDGEEAPRNKYGRTKQAAEQLCRAHSELAGSMRVTVLRISRCFPEDVLEPSCLSLPNMKANELLGRRAALVDVVTAHLLSLSRKPSPNFLLLTLAAPWPWDRKDQECIGSSVELANWVKIQRPEACRVYQELGWSMPREISRLYDSTLARETLGWNPIWSFDSFVRALEGREELGVTREDARLGRF